MSPVVAASTVVTAAVAIFVLWRTFVSTVAVVAVTSATGRLRAGWCACLRGHVECDDDSAAGSGTRPC